MERTDGDECCGCGAWIVLSSGWLAPGRVPPRGGGNRCFLHGPVAADLNSCRIAISVKVVFPWSGHNRNHVGMPCPVSAAVLYGGLGFFKRMIIPHPIT